MSQVTVYDDDGREYLIISEASATDVVSRTSEGHHVEPESRGSFFIYIDGPNRDPIRASVD